MRTVAALVALVIVRACRLVDFVPAARIGRQHNDPARQPVVLAVHPIATSRQRRPADAEQIRADLKLISPYTHAIRTYTSTGGGELVPAIAAQFGLKVTLGIWIDKNEVRNEQEIQSAIALARRYRNVNAIVVGNETTLRAEKTVDELSKIIQRVKRMSPVPVTTGEIWTVWIDHPELASSVDFIAAHILHYWDGLPADKIVGLTIDAYDKLRRAHPGKRVVIAEFGWPSAGYNMLKANPGRIEQAAILREFVARAEAHGIDYNIIEAFDQPWKTNEGGVGMYWGMFDASRHAEIRLDRAGPRSEPLEARRAGAAAGSAAVAAAAGARPCHRRRNPHSSRSPPTSSAPGSRSSSGSGRPTTSCSAPPSRSGSGSCC